MKNQINKSEEIMDSERKKVIEDYVHAYNTFDVEGMITNLHDRVIFENITNDHVDLSTHGIEEFRKQAEKAKAYFSQREQKIASWEYKDGQVTIKIDYTAVLAISLPNGMKPGDVLQLKGQSVFEFEGGRIVKIQDRS